MMIISEMRKYRTSFSFFKLLIAFFVIVFVSCYKPQPLSLPLFDIATRGAVDESVELTTENEVFKFVIASEDDAVKKALENNEHIKLLSQQIDIASNELESAGKIGNPELRVGDLTTRDIDEARLREIEVGLRWRSPRLGELSAERDIADANVGLAKVRQKLYKQRLCREVRTAYIEIVTLKRLLEIYDERIELERSKVSIVESQLALGMRTSLDMAEARLELFDAQVERDRIAQELKEQMALLEALIGTPIEIQASKIENKPIDATLEQLISLAYKNRPEFEEVFYEHRQAQASYHLERAKAIPWFSFVELSYHGEDDPNDPPEHWGELRFGFDLPIFNLNSGKIRAEKKRVELAASKLELTSKEIEKQVTDAYTLYKDSLAQLKECEKESATLIDDIEKVIEDAKKSGLVDPLKIVRIQLQMLDAKESLIKKQRQLALARIELLSAAGIMVER